MLAEMVLSMVAFLLENWKLGIGPATLAKKALLKQLGQVANMLMQKQVLAAVKA